ncbi:N-acetylmuramoyl-L-alanine amidase [Dasania sp. GY-MA-18]|uniref:N-acetylmuramoyl-L-alanine amidase AmiC n=1 Tax=Dasania phycosphaerae TaxID=2950436 RepID=A0A9J6RNG5_9GAMM|nr:MULTISPECIES: N-acetylmuramoyl-L-alanine amidase [Dasania]MCR8923117.1 N-acetylmuramoyl-L-alanine amidase [Dasania sp. GY-MA-18]MCZ0865549.1 N-acetylmuramoyl-L-alanine amidase [Dasania phycosphaerae]MCZ0869274.1 N-acetylmuramoyl-L-alanine amidase [Dasania phycosphaerae]
MLYRLLPQTLLIASLLLSLAVQAASVNDVRVWRAPDHTRVVLDLSKPVEHKVMLLSKPDRIVVDIDNTALKSQTQLSTIDLANTPITRVRSGVQDKTNLRVVLDVNRAVKPRSFMLKASGEYGDRLVIDLMDSQQPAAVKRVNNSGKKRDIIIAIDAGHGGEDPGATGPTKVREKHVVLAIAKELNALFEKELGYEPVMIRSGDYYVGLEKRRKLARSAQADLFVSIHADAFKNHRAKGASVYALSSRGASSATAKFLANEANSSDLVGGVNLGEKDELLAGVLADLSMTATLDSSLQVGSKVVGQMGRIAHLHSKRVEQAAFAVLKSPDIPSILVETGFISNPTEERNLKSSAYQRKMAAAIFNGIKTFFAASPPSETLIAWQKNQRNKTVAYTISRGDTLSGIAKRFSVSVADIQKTNGLASSSIRVGQKIIIPSS